MTKIGLLVIVMLFVAPNILGQQRVLTGIVTDSKTNEIIPYASVFVNNTSNATETNERGIYILKNIFNYQRGGNVEIVVSSLGYKTFRQIVPYNLKDTLVLNVALIIAPQTISEVSIKGNRDQVWIKQYKKFERTFLGTNENARYTKITNPWVVDFERDDVEFVASAQKILEVENKALGYKIFFELQRFAVSPVRSSFAGLARFEKLKVTDETTKRKIEEQRQIAYIGSERHFFSALAQKRLKKEGFAVYAVNPNYNEKNSFSHLNPQLGKRLFPFYDSTSVRFGRYPTSREIILPHEIEILNTNTINHIGSYQDAPFPISWLKLKGGRITVTTSGLLFDANVCEWAGQIAERRIADMLPMDYEPELLTENNNWKLFLPKTTHNTQNDTVIVEEAPPIVSIKHHFEEDTIAFHIQVKRVDGEPLRGRISVAIMENSLSIGAGSAPLEVATDTSAVKADTKAIILEEVKIKAKRNPPKTNTLLGKVDYIVDNNSLKDIISGNVITVLQSKVPGIEVFESIDKGGFSKKGIRIRGGSKKKGNAAEDEPLFLLDGIPCGTIQSLNAIPINDILQIEVIKKANSLLGSRGTNGAINIVTKSSANSDHRPLISNNSGKLFFLHPSTELSPQGEAIIRAGLPKGVKYYVIVNGITSQNQPFTKESWIE